MTFREEGDYGDGEDEFVTRTISTVMTIPTMIRRPDFLGTGRGGGSMSALSWPSLKASAMRSCR